MFILWGFIRKKTYLSGKNRIYRMNRIFHARIVAGQFLFLLLVSGLAVYMLWNKHVVLAVFFMFWLIVLIEKLIHTTYTVTTDGRLVLCFGRFRRSREIRLEEVTAVRRASSMRVGGFALVSYVLVQYGAGRHVALFPVKEEEFIKLMEKRSSVFSQ